MTSETFLSPEEKRERFGDGPWCVEPDRVEWRARRSGYPCLALRNPESGTWCGYVAVPPGHPFHGRDYGDDALSDLEVHGGLTFAERCATEYDPRAICYEPHPGEPQDVWWFGFDCGHAWDLNPGLVQHLKDAGHEPTPLPVSLRVVDHMFTWNIYRDVDFVRDEVDALATQLWEAK